MCIVVREMVLKEHGIFFLADKFTSSSFFKDCNNRQIVIERAGNVFHRVRQIIEIKVGPDSVCRQRSNIEKKIERLLQPVSTVRKISEYLKNKETNHSLVNQQCVCVKLKKFAISSSAAEGSRALFMQCH